MSNHSIEFHKDFISILIILLTDKQRNRQTHRLQIWVYTRSWADADKPAWRI